MLLRSCSQHHGSGVAGYADSGGVYADYAVFDFAPLRFMREQRMRFERHADLFPTAECAAALRPIAPVNDVGSHGSAFAADNGGFPVQVDGAGTLHDGFEGAGLVRWIRGLGGRFLSPTDQFKFARIVRGVHFGLFQLRDHVLDQGVEGGVFFFGLDLRHCAETDDDEQPLTKIIGGSLHGWKVGMRKVAGIRLIPGDHRVRQRENVQLLARKLRHPRFPR